MLEKVCSWHPQYFGNVVDFLVLVPAVFGLAKVLLAQAVFSLAPLVLFELCFEDGQKLLDNLIRINFAVFLDKLADLIDIDLLEVLDLALFLLYVRFALIEIYRVEFLFQKRLAVLVARLFLLQFCLALVLRLFEVLLFFLLGCILIFLRVLRR